MRIDSAGGVGAMPQRVERAVAEASEAGREVRLFVLCDSDARWPGDAGESKNALDKLQACCRARRVPLHVLRKRCVENYIPDQVYVDVRDDPQSAAHVERFDALLRRSAAQRDHFPVKDGLPPDERDLAVAAGLYAASDLPDLALLKDRLFPKRPRPLIVLADQRRAAFSAPGLRERDGHGELDALLEAIAREL